MWNSFRVLITERCNAKCPNCFNKDIRIGKEISIANIHRISLLLNGMGVVKLKVMGGEPTVHSQFEQCMNIFQSTFDRVMLFTNGINDNIRKFKPRANDIIDFNFNFISMRFDVSKFLLDYPGYRAFEIQIGSKTDIDFLKHKLEFIKSIFDNRKVYVFLTLDCTENIFLYRNKLISKWNEIVSFIEKLDNFEWNVDHLIPMCFYANSPMKLKKNSNKCSIDCAGLINANMQIKFCNQYDETICDFDLFESASLLERRKMFSNALIKKELLTKQNCGSCFNTKHNCNGGCFVHKCKMEN